MKAVVTKLPQSEVELTIEIPSEEINVFYNKAVLKLAENIEAPGFRKGFLPKEMVEEKLGKQKILEAAAEECLKENYLRAIKENKIEPLSQPEVSILKLAPGNPFEFKIKVAVMPEVRLPNYKEIVSSIQQKEVELTEQDVSRLKQEKERMTQELQRQEILQKIATDTKMEIPRVLIETETKRLLENVKQQVAQVFQISFEEYLKKINQTEQEFLSSLSSDAEKRVKNSLVLKKIEEQENIDSSEDEVRGEMEKILSKHPSTSQLDRDRLKEYSKETIKNEKTFQLLEGFIKKSSKKL